MYGLSISKAWSMGFEWHTSANYKLANFPSSLPQQLTNLHRGLREIRKRKGHSVHFSWYEIQLCDNKTEDLFTSAQQSILIQYLSPVLCVMLNSWITGIIFVLAFHPSLQAGELSLCAERGTWDDDNEGLPLSLRVIQRLHESWRDGLRSVKKTPSSQGQVQIVRFDLRVCWNVWRGTIWAQSNLIFVFPLFIWVVWSLVTLCNC